MLKFHLFIPDTQNISFIFVKSSSAQLSLARPSGEVEASRMYSHKEPWGVDNR